MMTQDITATIMMDGETTVTIAGMIIGKESQIGSQTARIGTTTPIARARRGRSIATVGMAATADSRNVYEMYRFTGQTNARGGQGLRCRQLSG
jgi:hypothetical protein